MNNIKIVVATHKEAKMPKDSVYLPVHVGKALHPEKDFGYQRDDDGDNISEKNPYYSELTAVYWAWKNLKADYVGLAHYRRHFCLKRKGKDWDSVLTTAEAESLCGKYDAIVTRKRRYYIETIKSHYAHTHDIKHLDITKEIIEQEHPKYLKAFDKVMNGTGAHMFNMFIMRKDLADDFCKWMFDVLFKLEERVDVKQLDAFQARLFGRVSEFLLDVWLETNNIDYKAIGYVHIGPYNFWRKVRNFLEAKLMGKKYSVSA